MPIETTIAYCLACLALVVVPGPTVTVIIANSLRHGAKAGLLNVAGTQAGVAIWLVIAVAGLGAALQFMGLWFDPLRWAGAAYLVWLGINFLRSKGDLVMAERARPNGSFFLQGFIVIMSNPKMLVLFGALIPPFIDGSGNFVRQLVFLGLIFMAVAALGDGAYALAAGRAGQWLSGSRIRAIETVSGFFLIAGGTWLALKSR
ncbi:MAG: LysE family translocator [Hyphomicrobiales bacterium]